MTAWRSRIGRVGVRAARTVLTVAGVAAVFLLALGRYDVALVCLVAAGWGGLVWRRRTRGRDAAHPVPGMRRPGHGRPGAAVSLAAPLPHVDDEEQQ